MRRIISVPDTGAGTKLIRADVLEKGWLRDIHQRDMPEA